jgi:very-short-patch-repair endonuclease
LRLIVEVDGASHEDKWEADQRREEWLKLQGYEVVRVTNADVNDLDAD